MGEMKPSQSPPAPEEREVIRCAHCKLNQFRTQDGKCRKCREPYEQKIEIPAVPHESCERAAASSDGTPDIAFALRVVRQALGLSQEQAAIKIGVRRQYICKVERKRVVPNVDTIAKMARAFGIEPWILLEIADAVTVHHAETKAA